MSALRSIRIRQRDVDRSRPVTVWSTPRPPGRLARAIRRIIRRALWGGLGGDL